MTKSDCCNAKIIITGKASSTNYKCLKCKELCGIKKETKDTYKKPCEFMYHIFTDGFDEWTHDDEQLLKILEGLINEGKTNIRVFKDTEWNEDDGVFKDGDVVFSIGVYPM